jgi:hypothetical protein
MKMQRGCLIFITATYSVTLRDEGDINKRINQRRTRIDVNRCGSVRGNRLLRYSRAKRRNLCEERGEREREREDYGYANKRIIFQTAFRAKGD